jgi:hypothetical protein
MKIIDNILYIEWNELLDAGVPEGTLKSARTRNSSSWTFISDPDDKRKVLIKYEKLQLKYKALLKEQYGDPYEYVQWLSIKSFVMPDQQAENFYLNFRFGESESKALPTEIVLKYTRTASWLNMLLEFNNNKKAVKTTLKLTIDQFYKAVMKLIESENKPVVKVDLPISYRRLIAKMKRYQELGYESLIDWRYGKVSNSTKVKGELAESILLEMIAHPNQYDDTFICRQYNQWAEARGYKTILPATVGVHRRSQAHTIIVEREGNEALREKYLKQAKGFRPTFPMALVESDDNHIDLQFIDPNTGNKYTRYKAVVVMDSFCDYVLGYAYTTDAVTVELVRAAYRNAMYHIKELTGQWHLPHELKTDNFGISNLQPWYEAIAQYMKTPVGSKHRGYIEQFFSSAHWKTAMKLGANNYTGNNITARNSGVNREFVNSHINQRPLLGKESEQQLENFFYRLRHMPDRTGSSRYEKWMNAWHNLDASKKRSISDEQFLLLFGIEHNHLGEGIRITNRGVEPRIGLYGKLSYDMQTYCLEHINKSVSVYYDPNNIERVLVTNHKDVRMMAFLNQTHHRTLADATTGSRSYLNRVLEEKKSAVVQIGQKSVRRKKILSDYFLDAEAVLQSGLVVKELKQSAEQHYFQPPEAPSDKRGPASDNEELINVYHKY